MLIGFIDFVQVTEISPLRSKGQAWVRNISFASPILLTQRLKKALPQKSWNCQRISWIYKV